MSPGAKVRGAGQSGECLLSPWIVTHGNAPAVVARCLLSSGFCRGGLAVVKQWVNRTEQSHRDKHLVSFSRGFPCLLLSATRGTVLKRGMTSALLFCGWQHRLGGTS